MKIFAETLAKIEVHNADLTQTYTLGVNKFSDMTYEELSAFYLVDFQSIEGSNKCERTGFDGVEDQDEIDW